MVFINQCGWWWFLWCYLNDFWFSDLKDMRWWQNNLAHTHSQAAHRNVKCFQLKLSRCVAAAAARCRQSCVFCSHIETVNRRFCFWITVVYLSTQSISFDLCPAHFAGNAQAAINSDDFFWLSRTHTATLPFVQPLNWSKSFCTVQCTK